MRYTDIKCESRHEETYVDISLMANCKELVIKWILFRVTDKSPIELTTNPTPTHAIRIYLYTCPVLFSSGPLLAKELNKVEWNV